MANRGTPRCGSTPPQPVNGKHARLTQAGQDAIERMSLDAAGVQR
ncbi:hypothetical protein [Streptomyces sp. NPDC002785]